MKIKPKKETYMQWVSILGPSAWIGLTNKTSKIRIIQSHKTRVRGWSYQHVRLLGLGIAWNSTKISNSFGVQIL